MSATLTCDLTKFKAALIAVAAKSKRPFSYIVNKALLDVAHKSAQLTPKTTAGKVNASLPNAMLSRMAASHLKKKQGTFTKAELKAEKDKIKKRRKRGIGGVRAGWIPAILKLGGSYGKAQLKGGFKANTAKRGTAKKATDSRLRGMVRNSVVTTQFSKNTQTGAGNIPFARKAMMEAIGKVARDRQNHADRKRAVVKVLKQNSDK